LSHKLEVGERRSLAPHYTLTTGYGQRSFAVSGSTLWNTLPPTVCDALLTLTQLCTLLKTMLFYRAYEALPYIASTWHVRL